MTTTPPHSAKLQEKVEPLIAELEKAHPGVTFLNVLSGTAVQPAAGDKIPVAGSLNVVISNSEISQIEAETIVRLTIMWLGQFAEAYGVDLDGLMPGDPDDAVEIENMEVAGHG